MRSFVFEANIAHFKKLLETAAFALSPSSARFSRGREFGKLHCKLGHAVQIEPGLRPRSPENGNISNIRRRLSTISLPQRPIWEPGDR
jgi:hypothetical protein